MATAETFERIGRKGAHVTRTLTSDRYFPGMTLAKILTQFVELRTEILLETQLCKTVVKPQKLSSHAGHMKK